MKADIYPQKNIFILFLVAVFLLPVFSIAQNIKKVPAQRTRPVWWIGESIGGNFNFYQGSTQQLNETVRVPTAFNKGEGLRLYFSFLGEYRPNKTIGGMLNVAFSNRSSSFDGVVTPNNEKAFLYTVLRYVNIEPSLRIAPFSSAFYIFSGPTLSINSTKEFFYQQEGQHEIRGNWGNLRKYVFGAQAGAGIDIPISPKTSANQITLSPFASFQTNLLDDPRRDETWNIYSFRAGMAVKFGTKKIKIIPSKPISDVNIDSVLTALAASKLAMTHDTLRLVVKDIHFYTETDIIANRQSVNEILPLRSSVFFDAGSTAIPSRYVQLTNADARDFREEKLQEGRPVNWYNTRSARQLKIYHNILNILGDRMRKEPGSNVVLSAGTKLSDGNALATNVKNYLTATFGIQAARITIDNSKEQFIVSNSQRNSGRQELRIQEDRRVDIVTDFPALLQPFNSGEQKDSNDSRLVYFVAAGAADQLQSWSIDINADGRSNHFGPFSKDRISLPMSSIMKTSVAGNYTVKMTGLATDGRQVSKTAPLNIDNRNVSEGLRYAVLFDFDRSKTLAVNRKFLEEVIAPQVTDSSTIIIHGHADVIGDANYNKVLSGNRVSETRAILEGILSAKGKKAIKFEYYGFGSDEVMSPFNNSLPEERFYNRTVIIDIIKGR